MDTPGTAPALIAIDWGAIMAAVAKEWQKITGREVAASSDYMDKLRSRKAEVDEQLEAIESGRITRLICETKDGSVDITEQENPGAAVAVNRFALVWFDKNGLGIADTGRRVTRLNGDRIPSGKRLPINADDTLQFGKTILQVKVILKKRTAAQK